MTFPRVDPQEVRDCEAALCRRSFADFVRAAWANSPRASALGPLVWNWHLDAVCLHLEAVARGEIRNLLVNVPPRSTKTELISIFFLPWVWTWRPGWKAIFASLTQELATDASVKCREVVESDWYQETFVRGAWELRDDKNAKNDFANTRGGSRFATSVGGTVIGRGAHCIVGDDLQKDGQSAGEWRATRDYWSGTLSSRADDPATVSKVCVQQRLGKGDLSEALLESGLFTHLCLPMQFGEGPANSNVSLVDGKEFWRDPRTRRGELLNPRRYEASVAERTYVVEPQTYALGCGPQKYRAQYNQNPANDEGGEIKRSYWRFHRDPRYSSTHRPAGCVTAEEHPAAPLPTRGLARCISADTAVKENQTADYSVVGTVGSLAPMLYVLDLDRGRVDIVGLVRMFKVAVERYPDIRQKYVEDKSSGQQLVQLMKAGGQVGGVKFEPIPGVVAVNPGNVSKVERTRLHLLPRAEAGQVSLPEGAPWLDEFVAECAAFPFGEHDDQIDMLAMACAKAGKASSGLDFARAMGTF